jgi:hypothetical protein
MSELISSAEKPLSPAAERMRLTRQRRAHGLRCITLEIRNTEIDALIARRLLACDQRNDPVAIAKALYVVLERALPLAH